MTSFANTLKQADIFYQLTPTQLEMISNICEEKIFNKDEIIFVEGADSDELYVLLPHVQHKTTLTCSSFLATNSCCFVTLIRLLDIV
jgi:signal-transduction protein with cAMP-binding, CBS, and nucleotidyltransferase domain